MNRNAASSRPCNGGPADRPGTVIATRLQRSSGAAPGQGPNPKPIDPRDRTHRTRAPAATPWRTPPLPGPTPGRNACHANGQRDRSPALGGSCRRRLFGLRLRWRVEPESGRRSGLRRLALRVERAGLEPRPEQRTLGGGRRGQCRGTPAAGTPAVTIKGFAFNPAAITVRAGTTITWANEDGVRHTVTLDSGATTSDALSTGATYSQTFATAGTFPYHCSIHPSMKGSVTVTP
ncbi:MAG: cupredoxin domain-containing protein [Chloroflexota bacterium]